MKTFILALIALAGNVACAQEPAPAVVHFYRTANKLFGVAISPSIFFDRDKVTKLGNGSKFDVTVQPGRYEIRAGEGQFFAEKNMKLESGREYYVRLSMAGSTAGVLFVGARLQLDAVGEDEARSAMRDLKTVDAKKIKNPTTGPLPE